MMHAMLVGALAALVLLVTLSPGAFAQNNTTDYDSDDDHHIEVASLDQLNAIRWDLDGDGTAASDKTTDYSAAFPSAAATMGCASGDHDDDANTADRPSARATSWTPTWTSTRTATATWTRTTTTPTGRPSAATSALDPELDHE